MEVKEIPFHYFNLETHWVIEQEKRLDARFYDEDVIAARVLIEKMKKSNIEILTIKDFSKEIFWPGRFKRRYISKIRGQPFIMPSEALMFLPKPKKFVTHFPENVLVDRDWLLITRSGSVGRCLITTELLKNVVVSDDLIRIIPKDKYNIGYIYAYLNTWIGQALLVKDQYGMTVKHIEPHHVESISIPHIPKLEKEINTKIVQAHKLIEEAQELILKAEKMIYSELGLPEIEEEDLKYFGGKEGGVAKSFSVKASELNMRLDASYHIPILKLIKNILKKAQKKGKYRIERIGTIAKVFDLPTYKRIYVKKDEGLPIVSGANLRQIKLYDLKYISPVSFYKSGKNYLERYRIQQGWILVTERGTIGVSSYVSKGWNNWLASHNILRMIPQDIESGYLLAFLNSEYAQYQLKSKELGAVVEVLDPPDLEDVLIPIPTDRELKKKIHNLVIEAYRKKDKANQIENEATEFLETRLNEIGERKNL